MPGRNIIDEILAEKEQEKETKQPWITSLSELENKMICPVMLPIHVLNITNLSSEFGGFLLVKLS